MGKTSEKIAIENVNVPGQVTNVNATKYAAMKQALLKALPSGAPGLTQKDMLEQVKPLLPDDLFLGGATSGWWAKTVQLALEAKRLLVREHTKPLRWYLAK